MMMFAMIYLIVALAVAISIVYTSRHDAGDGTKDAMDALRTMHDNSAIARNKMIR